MVNIEWKLAFLIYLFCVGIGKHLNGTTKIQTKYNEMCEVEACGAVLCSVSPYATCKLSICNCQKGYTTYPDNEIGKCCYKQTSKFTTLLLEVFLGFGIGHLYSGRILFGAIKLSIFLVFYGLCICYVYVQNFKENRTEGQSLLLRCIVLVGLIMFICIYFTWQLIDFLLIGLGAYKDGNGGDFY